MTLNLSLTSHPFTVFKAICSVCILIKWKE